MGGRELIVVAAVYWVNWVLRDGISPVKQSTTQVGGSNTLSCSKLAWLLAARLLRHALAARGRQKLSGMNSLLL